MKTAAFYFFLFFLLLKGDVFAVTPVCSSIFPPTFAERTQDVNFENTGSDNASIEQNNSGETSFICEVDEDEDSDTDADHVVARKYKSPAVFCFAQAHPSTFDWHYRFYKPAPFCNAASSRRYILQGALLI